MPLMLPLANNRFINVQHIVRVGIEDYTRKTRVGERYTEYNVYLTLSTNERINMHLAYNLEEAEKKVQALIKKINNGGLENEKN